MAYINRILINTIKNRKKFLKWVFRILFIFILVEGAGYLTGLNDFWKVDVFPQYNPNKIRLLKSENSILKKKIESLKPKGIYIIIDTANNILYLKENQKTLLQATISAGSGNILSDPFGKREWIFETPRGVFSVLMKFENPTWIKPDWAFIEEGKPIPTNPLERIEEGVLGGYAIGFGNGYFIHGTLYKRLLGKNVTHGCIRLGDNELKMVYNSTPIGAKIFIF